MRLCLPHHMIFNFPSIHASSSVQQSLKQMAGSNMYLEDINVHVTYESYGRVKRNNWSGISGQGPKQRAPNQEGRESYESYGRAGQDRTEKTWFDMRTTDEARGPKRYQN